MLIDILHRRLRERDALALRRRRRIAESPCAPRQTMAHGDANGRELLAFCSNDYLGLASHPALVEALAEGARRYGVGSGASHLINGHSRAHQAMEEDLADWLAPNIPDARALSFSTGYLANLALLTALAAAGGGADATLFCDQLNHASLIDGARLAGAAGAAVHRFAHRDTAALAAQLQACSTPLKLIVTDAVFSMDGDLADLPALLALAERFDAWLVVDDAHGLGVLGSEGRGTLAHFGLRSERLILMGTLGKAVGVGGAFVAAHPTIIDWLLQTGRSYIFTTAAPPALAHTVSASLRLIRGAEGDRRRRQLRDGVGRLRARLSALVLAHPGLSWRLADADAAPEAATAIQPLIIGDNIRALDLAAALESQGLWVPAIRPPTVPAGTARLRITLSAGHSADGLERLAQALGRAAAEADQPLARPAT